MVVPQSPDPARETPLLLPAIIIIPNQRLNDAWSVRHTCQRDHAQDRDVLELDVPHVGDSMGL